MDLPRQPWLDAMRTRLFLLASVIVGSLTPILLRAQEATPEATETETRTAETIFSLVMKGGPLMYPIFLCSLIVVTIAIERLISLRRRRIGDAELLNAITDLIPSRKTANGDALTQATEMCDDADNLVSGLLRVGVERLHHDEKHVAALLEETAQKEKHRLDRRLRPFAIVATLAPLLGLLGTVLGLILCFGDASTALATERAQKLSDGIYRSLVTTAAGMTVAIPAMVLDYYFQGRMDRVLDIVDDVTTRFLDFYYGELQPAPNRVVPSEVQPTAEQLPPDPGSKEAAPKDVGSKDEAIARRRRAASKAAGGTQTRLSQ